MKLRFFKCEKCGKIIAVIKGSACDTMCCGEAMKELIPGATDGAHEKHVPVFTQEGQTVTVNVGSVEHPMLEAHYIEWIAVETSEGVQLKELKPGDKPTASFALTEGDEVVSVFAYCNLHGLWIA